MIKAEEQGIYIELNYVYTTDDGKKFVDVDRAIRHQKKLHKK